MSEYAGQFYELPDGSFNVIYLSEEEQRVINPLVKFLIKLAVHDKANRHKLLAVWKTVPGRNNPRRFLCKSN